ncbi:hypothetical protein PGT21_025736 [Puccinia graminis f. sp. tritici]|uniref:Ketopantoate reductase C-terminal domain-containing protein n=2 Tax=Puccinia graminis f. sp. tritici TaxID=56615 RepID=A0A5B0ND53_PUCGR|nr:hypothetical protein PGT21_025736 [Puccinia graminis f. sp. tritici]
MNDITCPKGGIYAYVLERSQRCRVTAITRSLYDSIQTHGLTINSKKYGLIENWRPYRLVRSADEAADRYYRFVPTSAILAPFLLPCHQASSDARTHLPPTVVLCQNGIGIEQSLAEAFPSVHILSCVAWIMATLTSPSVVESRTSTPQNCSVQPINPGGPIIEHDALDRLVIGLYEGEGFAENHDDPDQRPCNWYVEGLLDEDGTALIGAARTEKLQRGTNEMQLFLDVITAGGCKAEAVGHIQPARWAKNMVNGAFSTMCTLSRASIAQFLAPDFLPHTLPAVRETMVEMLCVARALGYREAELSAETVDEVISLMLQNSQSKGSVSRLPSALKASPANQATDRRINPDVPPEDKDPDGTEVKNIGVGGPMGQPSFKPSMLIDMERNRPIELEPIIGAVLERAKSKAIETPRLDL